MTDTPQAEHIERDLARTRARMDRRLDELQDHLTPRQIVNDAFAYLKGGDGADFAQDAIARIKANPLPAVLTGVGLIWLMASASRPAQTTESQEVAPQPDIATRLRDAEESTERGFDESPETHAGRIDEARGIVLGIARHASETASDYGERIRQAMASALRRARESQHDLTANASAAAGRLTDSAQRGGKAFKQGIGTVTQSTRQTLASITANPFALGAIAVVVGLVAGALIPATEQEERVLGGTANRLRSAGRDLAQDVVDRGGRVASEALGALQDSAETHGLTVDKPIGEVAADIKSGALVGDVKSVASDTLDAGKASAQTHFVSAPTQGDEGQR